MEDVVGRGVDEPPDTGFGASRGQIAAADRVDAVEDALVGEPLLRQAHRVEDELAAGDGGREGGRLGRVASGDLDA